MDNKKYNVSKFISNISKGRNEIELLEAEENFTKYLLVVKDIVERLEKEGTSTSFFDEIVNKG
ncbi:MAG: hypothetical protein IPK88_18275 [Saprospiraceae bacterium]|nr:hypothetical protein [Candidatus Defluviibacterium haderslevense]